MLDYSSLIRLLGEEKMDVAFPCMQTHAQPNTENATESKVLISTTDCASVDGI